MTFSAVALLLLLVAGLCRSPASATQKCQFPAIINLFDSNSDTGGLSAAFNPVPWPYGISFFGHPAGRFCDGRLIVDFIAESLKLPYLSAYLDSLGANFSHGANFATAASTILPQNDSLSRGGYSPFSLDLQFMQYSQFQTRSQMISRKSGVFRDLMPKEEYFSQALYTFDIGQNDLNQAYFLNYSTEEVRAGVPYLIQRFTATIKGIYGKGGRYFWVHNTGPLGCLTYMIVLAPHRPEDVDDVGCIRSINGIAQYFNSLLKKAVVELRQELPLAAITYLDVYTLKYSLFSNGSEHGFVKPFEVCCGYGGGESNFDRNIRCGGTIQANGTDVLIGKSCDDPKVRISWDGAHYTEAANRWIFERIASGAYSDPPVPLLMACQR